MKVTQGMVKFSFQCFRTADILNIFPVTVDMRTGKLSYDDSNLSAKLIHIFLFVLSCLKCFHLGYALVTKLIANDEKEMAVSILIGLWGCLCVTATFWSYEIFHRRRSETIILFNSLDFRPYGSGDYSFWKAAGYFRSSQWKKVTFFVHDAAIQETQEGSLSWRQMLTEMSIQGVLLLLAPYIVNIFVPIYFGIMVMFPNWSVFIISMLETGSGKWIYLLAIGIELVGSVFMQFHMLFLFFFELSVQVLHIAKFASLKPDIFSENRSATAGKMEKKFFQLTLDDFMDIFQSYHVIFNLCNVVFGNILFTGKLTSLACAIFGTFFLISHIHTSSPIVLLFFLALSIQAVGFYTISIQKLFQIPTAMRNVKDICALLLEKNKLGMSPTDYSARHCKVKAMPTIRLSDGGFRNMDRLSVLLFIDFYLNKVISLLIM